MINDNVHEIHFCGLNKLSNEFVLVGSSSGSFLFRLDAEKEVDSLDILGDLDFKVKLTFLAANDFIFYFNFHLFHLSRNLLQS